MTFADKPRNSQIGEKIVTVGLVQSTCSDNVSENMTRTVSKIRDAAKKGVQIVCLQELFRTLYFPQEKKKDGAVLAETIPGESTNVFSALAAEEKIVIIAPILEKVNGRLYNSASVIDADGQILGTYRKIHIPQDPLFYEKSYFEPGNNGYCVFKTKYAKVGVLICYDQWFPEAARINALMGAEIIFYPTAIGYIKGYTSEDGDWHDAWKTVQRAHAISNGVHVASVNRVGEEGQLEFWGGSFVCDSFGMILKEASRKDEEVLVAALNLSKNKEIQEGWGFLKNRRPDTYIGLTEGEASHL